MIVDPDYPPVDAVAEMVRHKLDAGSLCVEVPPRVWAGGGSGQPCSVCAQPILEVEIEFEAQYDERPTVRFHHRCHPLWRQELRQRR